MDGRTTDKAQSDAASLSPESSIYLGGKDGSNEGGGDGGAADEAIQRRAGPLDLSEALRSVVLFGSWHLRMHVVCIPDEVDGADWALLQTHRSQEHRHQGVARRLSRSALSVCHPIRGHPYKTSALRVGGGVSPKGDVVKEVA